MILVVGGAASGKHAYVRDVLGYREEQIADAVLDGRPAMCNLQDYVAAHPGCANDILDELLAKDVVACDEVGSGIIPNSREQRAAREETGRLCIHLAQGAERVIRLVAGIPAVIK